MITYVYFRRTAGRRIAFAVPVLAIALVGARLEAEDSRLHQAAQTVHGNDHPAPAPASDHAASHASAAACEPRSSGFSFWDLFWNSDSDAAPAADAGATGSFAGDGFRSVPATETGMLPYPYFGGFPGYFDAWTGDGDHPSRLVAGQARAEYSRIRGDIDRVAWAGRLWLTPLLQGETEWNRYFARRSDGGHDTLTVGFVGLDLGCAITARAHLHAGLGCTVFSDHEGAETGVHATVGLDLFPVRHLVISASATGGTIRANQIDPGTFVGELRATAGFIVDRCELYAGWQSLHIERAVFEGPVGGLRVWF
jgi:hypothetical protein